MATDVQHDVHLLIQMLSPRIVSGCDTAAALLLVSDAADQTRAVELNATHKRTNETT